MSEEPLPSSIHEFGDLQEQFDSMAQQRDAATLGMWVFLATEILLFGGLFTAYFVYRLTYPEGFREGSRHLYVTIGSVNTAVLLVSSLFVALAVHAAKLGHSRTIVTWLLLAMAMGGVFLILKGIEYTLDIRDHLLPWVNYRFDTPHSREVAIFLLFYWIMTAIHALHMTIGIGVLGVIAYLAGKGRFSADWHNPVEISGLYWHFVDIVWIFLLPTFYLVSPHPHL